MGSGAGKGSQAEVVHVAPPKISAPLMGSFGGKSGDPAPFYPDTLLAADVGGTSARLHLFKPPEEEENALLVPEDCIIASEKYASGKWDSLIDVLRDFLSRASPDGGPIVPVAACLAVAGAVVDNKCHLPNLGWDCDGAKIAKALGIQEVHLINDFEAQGYGILTLDKSGSEVDVLQDVPPLAGAPIAVLGAGTGLGEAYMTTGENGDYEVWPSEGGHAEFAPRQDGSSKLQFEMCQYLQIKYSAKSRISVERIVSGRGIANIYQFLAHKFPEKVNKAVHRKFLGDIQASAKNDPAAIVEAARKGECEISKQALDVFVDCYGSEAGVVALKYMPFAGLYITGGVTSKTSDFITAPSNQGNPNAFMDSFLDKGRVSPMLMRVPVYMVRGENMGERGVKYKAMRMYQEWGLARKPSKGHSCFRTASHVSRTVSRP
mmetsp:Transcript_16665/g.43029  ORF Transcript_16665/g.43029 Transcript_16665/m.43029 type:complete len:433 (+) Transcript_16665:82-1380(+)